MTCTRREGKKLKPSCPRLTHVLNSVAWNISGSTKETLTPRRLISAAIIFFTATTSARGPRDWEAVVGSFVDHTQGWMLCKVDLVPDTRIFQLSRLKHSRSSSEQGCHAVCCVPASKLRRELGIGILNIYIYAHAEILNELEYRALYIILSVQESASCLW